MRKYAKAVMVALVVALPATPLLAATSAETYSFRADPNVLGILQTAESSGNVTQAIDALKQIPSLSRWRGATRGDVVIIYSIHHTSSSKPRHVTVIPKEKARSLHIATQVGDLLKVVGRIHSLAGGAEQIAISKAEYQLKEVRATLTITGRIDEGAAGGANAIGPAPKWVVVLDFTGGGKAEDAAEASKTVVTGPDEAWSISANVPLQTWNDVKLNDDENGITLKEDKPADIYAGLDYSFGDVLSTPRSWPEAVTIKLMLKASRRPLDSYGVALGLRSGIWSEKFPTQNFLHIFDTVSPFFALTRSRFEDEEGFDSAGNPRKVTGHSNNVIVGLGFDIKKALDWIQKPNESEEAKNQ